MITNTGKNIIAKYLIGQAPAYASYIAIGCGPRPVSAIYFDISSISATTTLATLVVEDHDFVVGDDIFIESPISSINGKRKVTATSTNSVSFLYSGVEIASTSISGFVSFDFSDKQNLDFEMFRVPITSRGYVNEDGISKIVLTAELPTEERYEISEVGIYSAGSNPALSNTDSKTLLSFDSSKNWTIGSAQSAIPQVFTKLDSGNLGTDPQGDNIIHVTYPVFETNSDNTVFGAVQRVARNERCRFFNNLIAIRGDHAEFNSSFEPVSGSYISLTSQPINLVQNAPTDELRLAFSVVNKNPLPEYFPEAVKILIEFSSSPTYGSGEWARMKIDISDYDFLNNRYIVSSTQLQDLEKSSAGFSWSSVNTIKIYSSVITEIGTSEDYFVCLDALKLENKNQSNPLYGLVGYTRISNDQKLTVVKSANKTSYIEFRFGLDVGNG
jgi:hypothetical protein